MAFCANCGNKVGDNDKFCANCGATRAPGAPAAQTEPPPPVYSAPAGSYQQASSTPVTAATASGESSTGLKANVAGLLCYAGIWVTGIIFLVLEKKSPIVRFHAAQSLLTFGFISILSAVLGSIFWHVWFLGGFLKFIIGIGAFILWIVLMVKAYQGEMYKLPIAGDIAAGIAKV